MVKNIKKSEQKVNGFDKINQFIPLHKNTKQPVFISQGLIDSSGAPIGIEKELYDQSCWKSLKEILNYQKIHPDILPGFVLTDDLNMFFIDLDNCQDNNGWSEIAQDCVYKTLGCYNEISISGKGLHIIGKRPDDFLSYENYKKLYKTKTDKIEFYTHKRYVALTFTGATGDINQIIHNLISIPEKYLKRGDLSLSPPPPPSYDGPRSDWNGPKTDNSLINKMCKINNAAALFGATIAFKDLWERNEQKLSSVYPPVNGTDLFDRSRADQALAGWLAFGTGCHISRIKKLMRKSALVRYKWDREDYLDRTINTAVNNCKIVYNKDFYKKVPEPPSSEENIIPYYDDVGMAERVADRYSNIVRYTFSDGWMIYNTKKGVWKEDKVSQITRFINETVKELKYEALVEPAEKAYKKYRKHSNILGIKAQFKAHVKIAITGNNFDKHKYLLNLENGVLDLKKGTFLKHSSDYMMTKSAKVKYDPSANCKRWKRFLKDIFYGDKDLLEYIQRVIGYTLTGKTSEQCFFFLYGTGSNGKTVFIDTIQDLLGDYSLQSAFSDFTVNRFNNTGGPTPEIAKLKGARFVSAAEVQIGERLDEAKLKEISGGGKITGRFLRKDPFSFYPECKIFLMANNKPNIYEKTHGIWRRLKVIPFKYTIPRDKQDKDLQEKLKFEKSGILNWALEGCLKWQNNGLKEPEVIKDQINEYRGETDYLQAFFDDIIDVSDPQSYETSTDLYAAFERWLDNPENKEKRDLISINIGIISIKKFTVILKNRGYNCKRLSHGSRSWAWLGLKIKDRIV